MDAAAPLSEAGQRHEAAYQACLTQAGPAPANEAPPTEGGLYISKNACPFEGCAVDWLHTREATELRAEPDVRAPVIATVKAGEWVWTADSWDVLSPRRGVVVEAQSGLELCDVVYSVAYGGEGEIDLWRRGDIIVWTDGGATPDDPYSSSGIRWDTSPLETSAPSPSDKAAREGWWLRLQHRDGTTGWVKDLNADCMGLIDPAEICASAPKDPLK